MGIVTGIGDKNNNINVITPQIDADLNKYILNKNAIIEGLQIVGNNLTAGMCVLCGYRGKLENSKAIVSSNYIYAKFTLNFNNTVDEFDIQFTNNSYTTPTSITSAGTYYLLLYSYSNGQYILNPELDTSAYPAKSHEADETDLVKSGAEIESGVTTPTPLNNNAHLTEPLRVANTKYVHKQIAEEIAADSTTIDLQISYNNTNHKVATLTLERKAKYVIGSIRTFTIGENDTIAAMILANGTYIAPTIPKNGFNPITDIFISIAHFCNIASATYARTAIYKIGANGTITHIKDLSGVSDSLQYTFGYRTN